MKKNKIGIKKKFNTLLVKLRNYFNKRDEEITKSSKYTFLIFLIMYSIVMILFFYGKLQDLLSIIGLNLTPFKGQLMFISYFFLMIYAFRYILLEVWPKQSIISKTLVKSNVYIILSFYIICLISIIGTSYLVSMYKPELPIRLHLYPSEVPSYINNIDDPFCDSIYDSFVVNDVLTCSFNITYNSSHNYLSEIEVVPLNQINFTLESPYIYSFGSSPPNSTLYRFKVPIKYEGEQTQNVILYFQERIGDSSYKVSKFATSWQFKATTLNNYNDFQSKKIVYITGFISLVFISVFSTVRNIKELMETK